MASATSIVLTLPTVCLAQPFSIRWENDRADVFRGVFGCWDNLKPEKPGATSRQLCSDRYYTNGLRLTWNLHQGSWLELGIMTGQDIFTPEELKESDLISIDRPYAGWLYVGALAQARHGRLLHTLEASGGFVGPQAGAEHVQRAVHRAIGATDPQGWANQIPNQTVGQGLYELRWKPAGVNGDSFGLIPHVRGAWGNVFTFGALGATLRFGSLPDDFGPHPTGLPARWDWSEEIRQSLSVRYYFVGAEVRVVDRNIFLDTSPSQVSKERTIWEFRGGMVFRTFSWCGLRVSMSWSLIEQGREFEGQLYPFLYGSWDFSFN